MNFVRRWQSRISAGAASEQEQAIGLGRGGNTSKIHLAVDSYGLPIEFIITGGDVHDSKVANELIDLLPQGDFVIADKGYDSEAIRDKIRERNSIPVIPRKKNFKIGNADIDWCLFKYRHLVEKCSLAAALPLSVSVYRRKAIIISSCG